MNTPPRTHLQQIVEDFLPLEYSGRREALSSLARIAENAERFEDMCKIVRSLVELDHWAETGDEHFRSLDLEERNLLSVAYKHVISSRRTSWRTLNADEGRGNPVILEYRNQLESELEDVCLEILGLLERYLIPSVAANSNQESRVFFLKLCGDYYRYLAEFKDVSFGYHNKAHDYYEQAYELAKSKLPGTDQEILVRTNPIRLGLALNYSVCYYEILDKKEQACALAREAFLGALAKLDNLDEHQYKDSTLILLLLRDNLTLWDNSERSEYDNGGFIPGNGRDQNGYGAPGGFDEVPAGVQQDYQPVQQ